MGQFFHIKILNPCERLQHLIYVRPSVSQQNTCTSLYSSTCSQTSPPLCVSVQSTPGPLAREEEWKKRVVQKNVPFVRLHGQNIDRYIINAFIVLIGRGSLGWRNTLEHSRNNVARYPTTHGVHVSCMQRPVKQTLGD